MGQILPGVPVWQAGNESRHPGMLYIASPATSVAKVPYWML